MRRAWHQSNFPEPQLESESEPNACEDGSDCRMVADTIVVAGTAYIIYRCIRMIPSVVIPPLWPTIPANVVVP